MTVKELIKKLSTFPEDFPILLDGYEGGLDEIASIEPIRVAFNTNKSDFFGPHEEVSKTNPNAIHISRY